MNAKKLSRRKMLGAAATLVAASGLPVNAATTAGPSGPARMERGYARGPFGQVHFQDAGRGRPLVLIHQAPMSSRQFESVYPLFIARGIRPIGIDCPGFGMSDPMTANPNVSDWARVVPPVLDHLGIRRADVLGHHTGALVATEVELQFRSRVRKLVLGSALPMPTEERLKFLANVEKNEVNFVHQPDGSHLQAAFMSRYRLYGANPPPDPKLITRYTVERFMGYGPFWHGHFAAFSYDHAVTIPLIRRPTLVITNTGDQIYEQSKTAKRMRPDFAFVELQGGGVDIVDQHPEEWVDAIDRFLSA